MNTLNSRDIPVLSTLLWPECLDKNLPEAYTFRKSLMATVDYLHTSSTPMQDVSEILKSFAPSIAKNIDIAARYLDNAEMPPYHSATHHAVVSLMACIIGVHNGLSSINMRELIQTAIVHDLDYNPHIREPGVMEAFSIERAVRLGIVAIDEQERITEINRATIFPSGREVVVASTTLRSIERILSDADLIGSCGISFQNYERETSLIEQEGGFKLNPRQRLNFLESVGPFESIPHTFIEEAQKEILEKQSALCREYEANQPVMTKAPSP